MRDENNLLVLTLYIIGVTYTFNRMVESIDDQVKLEFDKKDVTRQLTEQNLQDQIDISFTIKPKYDIADPKELSISVANKSSDLAIYLDWDNSALVTFDGSSRRVIRKSPDITRDLASPQNPSLIVPGKTLRETVTSEITLSRDKDAGVYNVTKPIANILGYKDGPTKAQKDQYKSFMARKRVEKFSLDLVLRLAETTAPVGLAAGSKYPPLCIVKCPFTLKKLPWTYALPWNKKR